MLKAILVVIERFSLTPALSRWERENGRQMVCNVAGLGTYFKVKGKRRMHFYHYAVLNISLNWPERLY